MWNIKNVILLLLDVYFNFEKMRDFITWFDTNFTNLLKFTIFWFLRAVKGQHGELL